MPEEADEEVQTRRTSNWDIFCRNDSEAAAMQYREAKSSVTDVCAGKCNSPFCSPQPEA